MSVYEKGLFTVLACDALFILLSLPLLFRKVPRNRVYGYRTRTSLSSDSVWYDSNAYFARVFIVASVVGACAAFWVATAGVLAPDTFLPVSVAILAAPVAVAALLTARYVRTLVE